VVAILSDIHGNLEALQAVLEDVASRGIDRTYCLGDVIGGGPNPAECTDLARGFDLCLAGHWEDALRNPSQLAASVSLDERNRRLLEWTRQQLSIEQVDFLTSRKTCFRDSGLTLAHASPLDYVNGYLFPEDIYNLKKMQRVFEAFDGLFVCGHTHLPGVHELENYYDPQMLGGKYTPASRSAVINAGSVGQPRDSDLRAGYVIYDGTTFEFVRVDYDWKTTQQKLKDLNF